MANSIAASRLQPQYNTGELPLIGAARRGQPVVNAVEQVGGQWFLDLLREAIDAAYSQKAAAADAGTDKGQWSRQLSGEGNLPMERVGRIESPEVFIAFAERLLARFGKDDKAARIERAMQLIEQGRAMLAAEASR